MNRNLRLTLFIAVALVQLAVAGGAIVKFELALRTRDPFRFRIQPVDPIDAFRGRYVAIRFAVDRAPLADGAEVRSSQHVFIPIEVDADGFASLGQADVDSPPERAYMQLRAGAVTPDEDGKIHVWVSMPFRRFYMDEDKAPDAERAVWSRRRGQRNASVSVRIRNGTGVIEELYIDDTPIHQWLADNAEER